MLEDKLKGYLNQLGVTLTDQQSIIDKFNKMSNLEKINFIATVENNYPSLVKEESLLNVSDKVLCTLQ